MKTVTVRVYSQRRALFLRSGIQASPPAREWRWRMTSRNGKILGASSEAFKRLRDARNNLWAVTRISCTDKHKTKGGGFTIKARRG
jgi:uncharacterized protein YegP (UPF0339 family)